ncbi:hypothetical protein BX286_5586 [Streptomyces sp. 3211.6]|uniref:hypothetical protein n=1 Tax=Streptomyces TaxID=1883 RepID=UPI0009A47A07|nr:MULTISPECIES: hypothetical protein [Streptomyces]RKT07524.1 hypothetical protein BX286_5586 [Streptomyces sp. 3211.6]RPF44857.1 hypothetical protein EDD96_1399 [Streptomyces sp. Ag109_G2-6]
MTLYGRSAVLNAVVPSLVGLEPNGPKRLRIPDGTPLLLVCGGGRGSGKSALLKALSDQYAHRVPQAYADLDADHFGQPGLAAPADGEAPRNASRTSDLLFYLMDGLSQKPSEFGGKLSFPRLVQGLLAITSWEPVRPSEIPAARQRLGELQRASQPDQQARNERVLGWIDEVAGALPAVGGIPPGVEELVRPLLRIVATELLGPRANKDGLKWWEARRVGRPGDGLAQLTELAMTFRGDAEDREHAERHLLAALLADVADHYGRLNTMNRVPRPLLLLDNAHTPTGAAFLDELARVWHEEAAGKRALRPAVVATVLSQDPPVPDPEDTAPSTRSAPGAFWRADRPAAPAGWLAHLPLAPLTLDEVKQMFGEDRPAPRTAQVIHRLSAGRAGTAHALVQAARLRMRLLHDAAGTFDPVDLLDLPADPEPGTTVNERILATLLPGQVARRRLTYYSPALDNEAVHRLAAGYPPDDPGGVPVLEAEAELRDGYWGRHPWPGTGGPFVGDPTLRALLLHRLTALTQATPLGEQWKHVHLRLRSFYDPQGRGTAADRPDVRFLHHSLALGEEEFVVHALHRRFAEQDAPDWLAALNLVCAAPRPPQVLPPPPEFTAVCRACAADNDPVHRAVRLLVSALWAQSPPLVAPQQDLISTIRLQLLTLAMAQSSAPAAQKVLYRAHEEWPTLLGHWRQAPHLPTYGESAP